MAKVIVYVTFGLGTSARGVDCGQQGELILKWLNGLNLFDGLGM